MGLVVVKVKDLDAEDLGHQGLGDGAVVGGEALTAEHLIDAMLLLHQRAENAGLGDGALDLGVGNRVKY